MRAVQLYIKLGKRANAAIRQLGYPTKNALKHWHRELARGNDLSHAAKPNEKWLTDITEFQLPAGKVYLSPMKLD